MYNIEVFEWEFSKGIKLSISKLYEVVLNIISFNDWQLLAVLLFFSFTYSLNFCFKTFISVSSFTLNNLHAYIFMNSIL